MAYMESASHAKTISPTNENFPPSLDTSSQVGASRSTPEAGDASSGEARARAKRARARLLLCRTQPPTLCACGPEGSRLRLDDADVDALLDDVSCRFPTRACARCDDASRAVDAILSTALKRAVRIKRLGVKHGTLEMPVARAVPRVPSACADASASGKRPR